MAKSAQEWSARISRRHALSLLASVPMLSVLPARSARAAPVAIDLTAPKPTNASALADLSVYTHAMHLHGSDSEGAGSWESHVATAMALGVTYIHPSDHDWRIAATSQRFQTSYHFASGLAGWLTWGKTHSGTASGSVSVVTINDAGPFQGRSALRLRVVGNGALATRGIRVTDTKGVLEGNVRGRRVCGDVLIKRGGVFEVCVVLSRHLGGPLKIRYRFGGELGDSQVSATEYVVGMPADTGLWTRLDVSPMSDAARLWPTLDAEDNSITGLELASHSTGLTSEVLLPRLELPRDVVGSAAVTMHNAMLDRVRAASPNVTIGHAVEYSWEANAAHLNGFFADRPALLLPETHPYANTEQYATKVSQAVHALGGVVSLNHPTGTSSSLLTPTEQAAKAVSAARTLIRRGLYGVDVVELGFPSRGGLGIDAFVLQLGAMLWRDGWFFTASGVSDDHSGTVQHWLSRPGITHTWAADAGLGSQLAALRAGCAHVTMWTSFRGKLWLSLNDAVMGSVQVLPDASGTNRLGVAAFDLPEGATITVYRGPVDYPGTSVSSPGLVTVADALPASAFSAGLVELPVDRARSWYYLAVARSSAGAIIGFTNPVWDLKQEAAHRPIPADRRVA